MKVKMADKIIKSHYTTREHKPGAHFLQKGNFGQRSFKIGWEKYISFVSEFGKYTQSKDFDNTQIYEVSEENKEITLRVNLLFEFNKDTEVIERHHITILLQIIGEVIFDFLELDGTEAASCVCIGKKDRTSILEFIFPTIRIKPQYYNEIMLPEICDRISGATIKRHLPEFKGDWDRILQPMTSVNHFYGCAYGKDLPVPVFEGIWTTVGMFSGDDDIRDSFSIRGNYLLVNNCSKELSSFDEDEWDNLLPFVLTSFYSQHVTIPKEKESIGPSFASDISSACEMEMIYNLFPIISPERFNHPMHRYQIGRCVYNIFKKDRSGIEFLHDSIRTDSLKSKIDWEELWEQYGKSSGVEDFLSIRTIAYYARCDNPILYNQWHKDWMKDAVEKSYNLIEMDIAEVMYRYFWLDYLTIGSSTGRPIWYRMSENKNRLVRCIGDGENSFSNKFADIIQFYLNRLKDNSDDSGSTLGIGSDEKKINITEKTKATSAIVRKLGSRPGQTAMMHHCYKRFNRENVDQFFDDNPNLIAWSNVVTEIHGNEIYCREGKMEDFITMCCEVEYHPKKYSMNHPAVEALMHWFKMVFIDDEVIEYFLKICASFLYGRNAEKSIYAFCGKGDNSKSMICKLLQKVLSVLAVDLPVSILTDDRQDKEFGSSVAQARGSRAAFISEPEDSIPFQGNLAKRLSGGDRIYARKLYTDGGSFIPMFKMIIGCNDVPRFENADKAVQDRLKILPFPSKFCDDAPDDVDEQFRLKRFPKDDQFEEKIDGYREPMAWLMGHYFYKYRTEKLKPPKAVIEYNRKYWERNDPYKRFVHENYEKTDNKSDMLPITKTYTAFKSWYMTNMNARKKGVPEINIFEKHLSSDELMGEPNGKRIWVGWRPILDSMGRKDDRNAGID